MTTAAPALIGFPDFGTDPYNVISASLTSSSNIASGTVTGSPSYNSDGVLLGTNERITWTVTTEKTELMSHGRMSMVVEGNWPTWDYTPATIEYLCSFHNAVANDRWQIVKNTNKTIQFAFQNTNTTRQPKLTGSGPFRFDVSWSGSTVRVYVNYLLVYQENDLNGSMNANLFSAPRIGGHAGANGPAAFRIKNFELSTQPLLLPSRPELSQVVFLGDSQVRRGNYPYDVTTVDKWNLNMTPDNTNYFNDGTTQPLEDYRDNGLLPTVHRELSKFGYMVGNEYIYMYARGGSQVDNTAADGGRLSDQVDKVDGTDLTEAGGTYTQLFNPKCVVIMIGTNDSDDAAKTFDATWEGYYTNEIDRLITAGAQNVYLVNVPTRNKLETTDQAQVTACNDSIENVVNSYASGVYLVDAFAALGGHSNYDTNDFEDIGGVHLTASGYLKVGKAIAQRIYETL